MALGHAREGRGQVVGVVGEPGVGKSRLCYEFVESCRAEGIAVYEAHCPAHGKNIPLLPILELFRNFFRITSRDAAEQARQKIAGTLVTLDPALHASLPLVYEFMGVADPLRPAPNVDPDSKQRQLFEIVRQVYQANAAQGRTSVTLIDDLHWIDPGSDAFVESNAAVTQESRNLLLLNFRPEYEPTFGHKQHYQQLPLVPLNSEAILDLVASLLGTHPSVASLAARIVQWTAGNPFFTEEVIQTLVETGQLEGSTGDYRLGIAVDSLEMPATVQAVLAGRIDRLPDESKHLLQCAAVIGKQFSAPLLKDVTGEHGAAMSRSIECLKEGDFIFERSLYPVAEYAFKHPLTHEVAYRSQLQTRRAETHAAVAQALEKDDVEKLDERAALLAYHFEEAKDPAQAVVWHRRAAMWAGVMDAPAAFTHWRRVHDLIATLPEDPDVLLLDANACARLLVLSYRMGGTEEDVTRIFEEGKRLAERSGDLNILAQLTAAYGSVRCLNLGDAAAYASYAREAVDIAEQTGSSELLAVMQQYLGYGYLFSGRLRENVELADRVLDGLPQDPNFGADIGVSPRITLLHSRSWALALMGRYREAEQTIEEGIRIATENEFGELVFWINFSKVFLALLRGPAQAVLDAARSGVASASEFQTPFARCGIKLELGLAHYANRNFEDAIEELGAVPTICEETSAVRFFLPPALGYLAESLLAVNQVDRALEVAREVTDFCRPGEARFTLRPWLALAGALIATGDEAGARAALEEAQQILDETACHGYEPFLFEVRAKFSRVFGSEADAEAALREAHRLFFELGADEHAERVAQQLS